MLGKRSGSRLLFVLAMVAALVPTIAAAPALAATPVFVNEIHYDNAGADTGEAIEIAGPAGTDLSGWSLVLYNGATSVVYNTTPLSGALPDEGAGFGTAAFFISGIQNGAPDGIALVDAGSSVVQFLSYEGSFTASGGPADGMLSEDIGVSEASSSPVGASLQLTGTGSMYEDFAWAPSSPNSFGSTNAGQAFTGGPVNPLIINEVDADQSGTDAAEFVEIYDGGQGNTDLSGLVLVLYNGNDDASYQAFDLDGASTDADGYFVLCGNAATVANCDLDVTPDTNLIQNGADAVALYEGDAADFPTNTAVTTAGLIDALVYDTSDGDDAGLLVLLNAGQPQVNENGRGSGVTDSNQRCPNGSGGARNTSTYDQFAPTPGEANLCEDPAMLVKIHEVQGPGDVSPLVGQTVVIEGVVVGDFQEPGQIGGFHVQEEDVEADTNPDTSEGIYVFAPNAIAVSLGDTVRVTGTVAEFNGLTEITNFDPGGGTELIPAVGPASPTVLTLPFTAVNDFERYEGMSVIVPQDLVITEFFNYDRFGQVLLGTERLPQPTAIFEPGSPEAAQEAADQALQTITLDDGLSGQNPFPARHPNGADFGPANLFRGGDTLTNVRGVMEFSFGSWKIQPTVGATHTVVNPRPAAPADVGGDVTVAAFNVLNYYTTLDQSGAQCFPSFTRSDCRGADNAAEFDRQRTKIIAALAEIDTDVVGLIEIENNVDDDAVIDLVAGLNDALGAGTYDYVPAGITGPDTIKVALIYKPDVVSLNGAHAVLEGAFLDPNNTGQDRNRAALAQTFTENATGESFTVAVNHFKSKGSPCGPGDDDPETGSCNLTRTLAAELLVDWLAGDPTGSGDPDVLVIGDLNSYDKEDPIDEMRAGGYSDLVFEFLGENEYSFVFSGQWGYLDYAMANESLQNAVTGTTVWHINADEPDYWDYNTDFSDPAAFEPNAFRSSDHDPVIVGLNLANPMGDKMAVSSDLADLLPTGDSLTDKRLSKAIAAIDASLNPAWWTSDQTITDKKVFDNERRAVAQLVLVVNSGGPEATTAQAAIDTLVNADRQLAQIELIAAIVGGGNPGKIADAQAAMADAAAFVAAGQYVDAINAYKAAWDAATKA